ncbi:MAG TPA: lactate utilization protein [Anaerolineae bacterium]|nr:lactate utilization protein [Anaerolineae bacterium]
MTTKAQFLGRVRASLNQALVPDASPEHPGSFQGYVQPFDTPGEQLVDRFKQELEALSGRVYVLASPDEASQTILHIMRQRNATNIISWQAEALGLPGLRETLQAAGITISSEHLPAQGEARRSKLADIDDVKVGLTGALGGLADTGAVALVSGPGRSRLASLLPPVHIALLPRTSLYPSLPAFLAAHPETTAQGSNLVFIAGPSRTADIELTLTMGVHGPAEIHVIIVP